MVCRDTAKTYLSLLNGLISALGLGVIGLGVFAVLELGEQIEALDLGEFAEFSGVALGVIILLVGVLGCYGARQQSKVVLVIYWVILTVITMTVLALGAGFVATTGILKDVEGADNLAGIEADAQQAISDGILAVHKVCCVDADVGGAVPDLCEDPPVAPCIFDQENFDQFANAINPDLCNILAEVEPVEGVSIISDDICADAENFQKLAAEFFEENLQPIGITFIVLSVVLLLAELFTCCLICSNREDFDAEYRKKQQQQKGGAVSGTSGQGVQYA